MNPEFTTITISQHDWTMLQNTLADLQERVATLESKRQHEEDVRGYAEQGVRYSGKHPRTCACNRCLGLF